MPCDCVTSTDVNMQCEGKVIATLSYADHGMYINDFDYSCTNITGADL